MTQKDIFETYMQGVWANVLTRNGADVYATDHDATIVAKIFGACPTGASDAQGEDGSWTEWLFPDWSRTWILIRDGEGMGTEENLP